LALPGINEQNTPSRDNTSRIARVRPAGYDRQGHDEALLALGFDWLKNVMFNEPTISMKQEVPQDAIARTRDEMGAG
jgi:hypothetical protein